MASLTPEQQVVAESWHQKKNKRQAIYKKLSNHELDPVTAMQQIQEIDGDSCEHGRHYSKECAACDELSELLGSDFFH